ncbi:MAG: GGDEF domain-containing protein, partial [Oscillospiraceae bacterium]|nr:GGDEF domain-containing protein [Oscillospiraceae bacterium]
SDPGSVEAVFSHLTDIDGYFTEIGDPSVSRPSSSYRFMTISPIRYTDWSVVILSGEPSPFGISMFIPISAVMLLILISAALITGVVNYRLIFLPLGKLDNSLSVLKEKHDAIIYGTDRDDELGDLSKTIRDLFIKANIDALTGIYNRRFMEHNLQYAMELMARSGGLLSVLMFDVDHFKKYNDTYGHAQGDECLKKIAGTLAGGITRASDFAARYGGEEFIAVLPNTDEDGARAVAESLLEKVRELNIPHSGNSAASYVTISIGGATGKVKYMQTQDKYIKRADEALYMSKENGRNRYTYLSMPEIPER